MSNNNFELVIPVALCVPIKAKPFPRFQSCTWALPWFQEVKINVGAVAMGSPGIAGTDAIARNHNGEVIGVLSHGVGIKTLFYTECEAVIGALFWAVQRSWNYIWIEADFQSMIQSFSRNQVPWHHRARWNKIEKSFLTLRFSHCCKVANFSAIQVAKRSRYLPADGPLFHPSGFILFTEDFLKRVAGDNAYVEYLEVWFKLSGIVDKCKEQPFKFSTSYFSLGQSLVDEVDGFLDTCFYSDKDRANRSVGGHEI
ncbi:hypothetical protein GIB67_031735 [Kingdonia uniflora]|uniref:RNase H type-1 domain-containing protein n=1 Tax=Kingdonia uniflora TaxID=39325 RepID=A0A7J7NKQ1_9MAGN|nr:hypothetical protein GIB67_031735 [Kingdonia uniflora]